MKRISLVGLLGAATSLPSALLAQEGVTLLSNSKANVDFRTRYEWVSDASNARESANATTLRTNIGFQAELLALKTVTLHMNTIAVLPIGGVFYEDASTDANTRYDRIVDPEQTRITQGYVQYNAFDTAIQIGRQGINLDNQRFVGTVDWRQMPQSFDAVSVLNNSVQGVSLYAAYVYSYATIFEEPTWKSQSLVFNASYSVDKLFKITLYDYMLSLEKAQFAADTLGVALSGEAKMGEFKMGYRAEYAKQNDATFKTITSETTVQNNAQYYMLDLTGNIMGLTLGTGYEMLSGANSSENKTKFQTPLATLHKFNGTADKFLATPSGGVIDGYLSVGYSLNIFGNASVVYHKFQSDVAMGGKYDLGSEWDVQYANAVPYIQGLKALVKAAIYNGGSVTGYDANVRKAWLQLAYSF